MSLGGRNAEMTFGIGDVSYTTLHTTARTISGGPNDTESFNLAHLPSDAVAGHKVASNATNYPVVAGEVYEVTALANYVDGHADDAKIQTMFGISDGAAAALAVGDQLTVATGQGTADNSVTLASGILMKRVSGTNVLTTDIEAVQAKINTARVQAGSQYAALESAVSFTTDLTAQYELGFNTVNDVNFSMETAHLAKNQILQQAATAMLAQANQGQQGLLQLIQG